jgi:hypothetical protein
VYLFEAAWHDAPFPPFVAPSVNAGLLYLLDVHRDGALSIVDTSPVPTDDRDDQVFWLLDGHDHATYQVRVRKVLHVTTTEKPPALRAENERKAAPRNYTVVSYECSDDASGCQFIGQTASFAEAYALARDFDGYTEDQYPTPAHDGDAWEGRIGGSWYVIQAYPNAAS